MRKRFNISGFTMTELVVTVALMGTLLSLAAPKFTNVSEETQGERNIANMHTIKHFPLFLQINAKEGYVAHFPPSPDNENNLMDDEWAEAAIDSSISLTSPNNLFSRGGVVPKNANNYPFKYTTWKDTVQITGEIRYYIKIEDIDIDSPSYGKSFTYNI